QLSNIFRLAHSLKGGGMAVGLKSLSGFAHTVEDFLAVLRSDPGRVDLEAINLLLKAGDALKVLLGNAKNCDDSIPQEITSLKELISQATLRFQGLPPATPPLADAPVESKSNIEIVEFAGPDAGPPAKPTGSTQPPSHKSVVKVDTIKIESILDLVGEVVIL